jgi:hypothetical protein
MLPHAKIQAYAPTQAIYLVSRAIVPQLISPEPFVRHQSRAQVILAKTVEFARIHLIF